MNYDDVAKRLLKQCKKEGVVTIEAGMILMTEETISEEYKGRNFIHAPFWMQENIPMSGQQDIIKLTTIRDRGDLVDILKDVFE